MVGPVSGESWISALTTPVGPTPTWALVLPSGAGTELQVGCDGEIRATTLLSATAGSHVATATLPSAPIAARTNSGTPPVAIVNGVPNSSSFGPRYAARALEGPCQAATAAPLAPRRSSTGPPTEHAVQTVWGSAHAALPSAGVAAATARAATPATPRRARMERRGVRGSGDFVVRAAIVSPRSSEPGARG